MTIATVRRRAIVHITICGSVRPLVCRIAILVVADVGETGA
jgi:hypothetical protein